MTLRPRGDSEAAPGVQEAASEHPGGAEAGVTVVRTHTGCREAEQAVRLTETRPPVPAPHTRGLAYIVIPAPAQILVTPVLAILNTYEILNTISIRGMFTFMKKAFALHIFLLLKLQIEKRTE